MSQGLFYKAKDGKFYSCKLEIKKDEEIGRFLIFTINDFTGDSDELNKFGSVLRESLDVDMYFFIDSLKDKMLDAFMKSGCKKDFKYVDAHGNTFSYDENSKKWVNKIIKH